MFRLQTGLLPPVPFVHHISIPAFPLFGSELLGPGSFGAFSSWRDQPYACKAVRLAVLLFWTFPRATGGRGCRSGLLFMLGSPTTLCLFCFLSTGESGTQDRCGLTRALYMGTWVLAS
jgi:hypothetical protein